MMQDLSDTSPNTFTTSWVATSEFPHHYRVRRCAIIPDVVLTPEDELVITNRIGYRPVPPPNLSQLARFMEIHHAQHAPENGDMDDNSEIGSVERSDTNPEEERDESAESGKSDISDNEGKEPKENENSVVDINFDNDNYNTDLEQSTIDVPIRSRRPSWNIDIPHMTDIEYLRLRTPTTTPGLSPFSEQISPSLRPPPSFLQSKSPCSGSPFEDPSPREGTKPFVWT